MVLIEQIVAPSAIKSPINPHTPRELTAREIEQVIDDFSRAATLAREAGYDGVEIMGSEGYLITQFLAARTNRRTDEWGGALENRVRFASEMCAACVPPGPQFIVVYRISALDLVEGGFEAAEIQTVARAVADAGATLLNTGIGWHEARIPTIAQAVPRGGFAWATQRLKEGSQYPGGRIQPHQRSGSRRSDPRAWRCRHGLARARDARRRGLRK